MTFFRPSLHEGVPEEGTPSFAQGAPAKGRAVTTNIYTNPNKAWKQP